MRTVSTEFNFEMYANGFSATILEINFVEFLQFQRDLSSQAKFEEAFISQEKFEEAFISQEKFEEAYISQEKI